MAAAAKKVASQRHSIISKKEGKEWKTTIMKKRRSLPASLYITRGMKSEKENENIWWRINENRHRYFLPTCHAISAWKAAAAYPDGVFALYMYIYVICRSGEEKRRKGGGGMKSRIYLSSINPHLSIYNERKEEENKKRKKNIIKRKTEGRRHMAYISLQRIGENISGGV